MDHPPAAAQAPGGSFAGGGMRRRVITGQMAGDCIELSRCRLNPKVSKGLSKDRQSSLLAGGTNAPGNASVDYNKVVLD
jgi:hypothetical protein